MSVNTSHPHAFISSFNHGATSSSNSCSYDHTHPQYKRVIEIIKDLYKTNTDLETVKKELESMLKIADSCQCFVARLESPHSLIQQQNAEDAKIVGYIQSRLDTLSQDQLKQPESLKKSVFQRIFHR